MLIEVSKTEGVLIRGTEEELVLLTQTINAAQHDGHCEGQLLHADGVMTLRVEQEDEPA